MAKIWKFSFQITEDEVLIWTLNELGTILECDLPQYDVKLAGDFLLLHPEDYKVGEKPDLFDKNYKLKPFPYKIQHIEEMEEENA